MGSWGGKSRKPLRSVFTAKHLEQETLIPNFSTESPQGQALGECDQSQLKELAPSNMQRIYYTTVKISKTSALLIFTTLRLVFEDGFFVVFGRAKGKDYLKDEG